MDKPYCSQLSEKDVVAGLIFDLRERGYKVRRNRKLKFGSIDLLAWNDAQIVVFEVKHGDWKQEYAGCFHDVLEGLGQLLCYREQYQTILFKRLEKRQVRYVLFFDAELDFDKEYQFLKDLCTKYGVILHMRLVEQVKYL